MVTQTFGKVTFVNFGLHHKYGSYRFLFVWNATDHCHPESFNSRSADRSTILAIPDPNAVRDWQDHGKCNNDCAHCPKNHFTTIGSWGDKIVPCHQWEKVGWFINDPYSCKFSVTTQEDILIEVITRDEEARNPTRACFQVMGNQYNRYVSTRHQTPEGKDIAIMGCIVKLEDDPYKTDRYQQYLNMYRRRRYQRVFKQYRPDEWRLVDPYAQYFPSIP